MTQSKKHAAAGVVLGMVLMLLLLLITLLCIVYTGSYNVAATEEHRPFVRWAFSTTLHNSVEDRASDIKVPKPVNQALIAAGASEYKAMCQHCHAGPGVDRAEWARGMLPQPPLLAEAALEWEINEVFWIVKHGLKMTGMPAFGPTHDEKTLWSIAAFVNELPTMTAEEYAAFESGHNGGHSH